MTDLWKSMRPPLVTSLVTTVNEYGEGNASPKSWWTPVSYEPPKLVLSTKPESDTTRNIACSGWFVLHLPPESYAEKVLHTAKPLPYGENELDDVELPYEWRDFGRIKLPVVLGMPWMLCSTALWWLPDDLTPMDHQVWLCDVVEYGGFDDSISSVLLHRGRNEFMEIGAPFTVTPY